MVTEGAKPKKGDSPLHRRREEHRNLRRLHGNGLARDKAEVGLLVLAQTALMLARLKKLAATPADTAA